MLLYSLIFNYILAGFSSILAICEPLSNGANIIININLHGLNVRLIEICFIYYNWEEGTPGLSTSIWGGGFINI